MVTQPPAALFHLHRCQPCCRVLLGAPGQSHPCATKEMQIPSSTSCPQVLNAILVSPKGCQHHVPPLCHQVTPEPISPPRWGCRAGVPPLCHHSAINTSCHQMPPLCHWGGDILQCPFPHLQPSPAAPPGSALHPSLCPLLHPLLSPQHRAHTPFQLRGGKTILNQRAALFLPDI